MDEFYCICAADFGQLYIFHQVVAAMDALELEGMKCYRAGLGGPGVTVKLL